MVREQLSIEEVVRAIERKGGTKIPVVFHKWWGNGLEAEFGSRLNEMAEEYPEHIFCSWYQEPGYEVSSNENMSYRLGYRDDYCGVERHSIGVSVKYTTH